MIEDPASPSGNLEPLNERQSALLGIVHAQGFATIEALAERFEVSAQTIRRDIIRLNQLGVLQRFHGGAGAVEGPVRLGYTQKQGVAIDAKSAIGAAAASRIAPGSTVFLDVGTTVEAAARALASSSSLRVFTNSIAAAAHLAALPNIEVVVAGGRLRGADGSLVGDSVTAWLRELRFDVALIGLSGWDDDGAPMDFDIDKIAVKRTAIDRAHTTLALCDAAKFDRAAVARIVPAEALNAVIADRPPPPALAHTLRQASVEIVIAGS